MPVYFYSSWYSSKATDVDVEAMIKGYDAIKSRLEDILAKGFEATNKENGKKEKTVTNTWEHTDNRLCGWG